MSVGVLVAAGIGVAVFEGRNGKDPVPCEQARGHIHTIERLSHGGRLTADEVAQLHDSASRLTAIAAKARGDAVRAITDAATVAGSTTAGQTAGHGQAHHGVRRRLLAGTCHGWQPRQQILTLASLAPMFW